MSPHKKASDDTGYAPQGPPPPPEPAMTLSQYQSQQEFFLGQVKALKQMFEESPLRKYIVMAGVSALIALVLEGLHIIWLGIRFVGKF
jgi:hypothetical protein